MRLIMNHCSYIIVIIDIIIRKGNLSFTNVTLERRIASVILSGTVRSDYARRMGLRDASLDGSGGK